MIQQDTRMGRRGFLARMGIAPAMGASGLAMPYAGAFARQATPATDGPSISHRQIETNGISMHIAEAGEGPLVVMIHGFPEMWYSWRHQLPNTAAYEETGFTGALNVYRTRS